MSHPLLTKVLREAFVAARDNFASLTMAQDMVKAMTTDIADRLERALDVCQYPECATLIPEWDGAYGHRDSSYVHECSDPDDHEKDTPKCHPYQPLVTP